MGVFFVVLKEDLDFVWLSCFVDFNGLVLLVMWVLLVLVIDGVMVDLKCLDFGIYWVMIGYDNGAVLVFIC